MNVVNCPVVLVANQIILNAGETSQVANPVKVFFRLYESFTVFVGEALGERFDCGTALFNVGMREKSIHDSGTVGDSGDGLQEVILRK